MTINAIVAADEILIPVQPQYLPAIGMTQLVRTIEEVRTNMKPDLKYSGIVFTLVNMQTNIAKDTIESVKETFGKHIKVYESYIPIATKVSESAIHGRSIYDFSSDSKASKAYEELTKEFLKDHREKKRDIPSSIKLADYQLRLVGLFMREKILSNGIETIKKDYDYILIDCPPTLEMLTLNAIAAADEILIPVQTQYLSAVAMTQLIRIVEEVKTNMKPNLKYSGIVFTLVNSQTNIAKSTMELVKNTFGSHIKVFDSYIPIATKVSESAIYGKSIYDLSTDSKASQAYEDLTKEFQLSDRIY